MVDCSLGGSVLLILIFHHFCNMQGFCLLMLWRRLNREDQYMAEARRELGCTESEVQSLMLQEIHRYGNASIP
ncbi:hypothetical protein S245_006167 [Arachis hypogaea]